MVTTPFRTPKRADNERDNEDDTSLPYEAERELLRILCDPALKKEKFLTICNRLRNEDGSLVFGERGSSLRRSVQRRRDYLLRSSDKLQQALNNLLPRSPFLTSPHNRSSSAATPTERTKRLDTPQSRSKEIRPDMSSVSSTPEEGSDKNNTFQLFFNKPWLNPHGVLSFEVPDVRVNKKLVTKVRILKHVSDMEDYEQNRYSARLTPEGDGIIVTEPYQPNYLADRDNVESITTSVEGEDSVCDKTKAVYETVTTTMKKKKITTRPVYYYFPTGTTCNNKSFNDGPDGKKPEDDFELHTKIAIDMSFVSDEEDVDASETVNLHPFLVWEVAVDEQEDTRETEIEDKQKKDLTAAMKNMKIASSKKKKKTGTSSSMENW
jgi:hypothetical protein